MIMLLRLMCIYLSPRLKQLNIELKPKFKSKVKSRIKFKPKIRLNGVPNKLERLDLQISTRKSAEKAVPSQRRAEIESTKSALPSPKIALQDPLSSTSIANLTYTVRLEVGTVAVLLCF